MKEYDEFVPDVHFELIPIKRLVSNQDYQRSLSVQHVKKTAENFDLYQINPVKVSRRNGINYVFNGQHTIEVVALVSGSRDTPVWCMVYDDMDYKVEADVFANQQRFVKGLAPYEIFMANIEAENETQMAIKSLVESYDLKISKTKAPGMICAVSSLECIYKKYGFHVLDRSIRLCVGAWEGEAGSLSSGILKGIAILIAAFGDTLRDDVFKEKVGAYSSREISRLAKERKAGSMGFAEAMMIAYNRKVKKGLSWVKLYSGKKALPPDIEADMENEDEEEYSQEV
ncbi:DUF6551 family protein [Succiniclasticum ruminis]|uniref:ParB-like nuclease domain-containing protein n=1 Tax=Succiniclasticum ruminis DSM 9236 TaxID=1123323 RepID=A0A1I2E914_9FIRM|nr:DUF6551 family protein [Succiniclasticum ruminis]SFE89183.1 hypothetical protein SAMN05216245_1314 [Succiniclasticum ruminis DSM 9236]